MPGKIERLNRRLLGRNLDRAMRISAIVSDWNEDRRETLRRILNVGLTCSLRRIESGDATAKEAADKVHRRTGTPPKPERSQSPIALADELHLIFLTALSHEGNDRLSPLREYTFRCINRILRTPPKHGQASIGRI